MSKKLTVPQRRYLLALFRRDSPFAHCKTQSDYGGLQGTIRWAFRNNYIKWSAGKALQLTPAGRALAKTLDKES